MIMPETMTNPAALPDGGGAGVPPLPEMKKTEGGDVLVETFIIAGYPEGNGRGDSPRN